MDIINELKEIISFNNIHLDSILTDIVNSHNEEFIPFLLDELKNTENPFLRNKIALTLRDLHCQETVDIVIQLLKDPKTFRNKAVLLSSLRTLDYGGYIEYIVEFIDNNYSKVRNEAMILIEKEIEKCSEFTKQKLIKRFDQKIEDDNEKLGFFYHIINKLTGD